MAIYNLTPSLLTNGSASTNKQRDSTTSNTIISIKDDKSDGEKSDTHHLLSLSDSDDKTENTNENEKVNATHGQLNEKFQKKNSGAFPIPLALAILIVWISFSAAMFCLWETEWGYLTSVYFFFVSISTVGLGDIVPTKPDMMFINFMLILIGLALLSMCVNLIQDALERLIEQLIEEYIDEIEKIAAVVTNTEEFAEETEIPFEVGMTATMMTVPIASIAEQAGDKSGIGTWRTMKDWMAERIASKVLMSRLDPQHSSDSESDSDSECEFGQNELNTVVVSTPDGLFNAERAKVSVVHHDGGIVENVEVPTISIHEGTPVSQVYETQKVICKDALSFSSDHRRSKRRKHPPLRNGPTNTPNTFSRSTMRAIQAIEAVKMRNYKDNDFKSRVFAKFATNQRFVRYVDDHVMAPNEPQNRSKMVNSCCQTSPPPPLQRKATLCSVSARNFTLESMDSVSSDIQLINSTNDWTSLSVFDADSLCSAGYYDMSFGGYSTDSVPKLMADANTPVPPSVSGGTHNQRYPFRSMHSNDTDGSNMSTSASAILTPFAFPLNRTTTSGKPVALYHGTNSMPGSPPIIRRNVNLPPGAPCITPTELPPKISFTDCGATTSEHWNAETECMQIQKPTRLPPRTRTIIPTATPTSSPIQTRARSISGQNRQSLTKSPPLLASTPLHHRLFLSRRRFSDNNCLGPQDAYFREPTPTSSNISSILTTSLTTTPCINDSVALQLQAEANALLVSGIPKISKRKFIDGRTVKRVQDACGLFPFDFLKCNTTKMTSLQQQQTKFHEQNSPVVQQQQLNNERIVEPNSSPIPVQNLSLLSSTNNGLTLDSDDDTSKASQITILPLRPRSDSLIISEVIDDIIRKLI